MFSHAYFILIYFCHTKHVVYDSFIAAIEFVDESLGKVTKEERTLAIICKANLQHYLWHPPGVLGSPPSIREVHWNCIICLSRRWSHKVRSVAASG